MNAAGFFFDALRALLLFGTTLVVVAALGKATAATRRAVLVAAMVAALFSPIAARVLSASRATTVVELPFVSFKPAAEPEGVGAIAVPPLGDPLRHADIAMADKARPVASTARASVMTVGIAVWALGAAALVVRLVRGIFRATSLARRARRDDARPFAAVIAGALGETNVFAEVAISDDIDSPAVAGLFRPVVLMPRSSLAWNDDRWRVVLLHELAHVRRRDCLMGVVAQLVCAVHWFDPLVWLTRTRWQKERELAADEDVLQHGVRPSSYAEHLLDVASAMGAREVPVGALAMADRASGLAHRVENIVRKGTPRRSSPRVGWTVAAATAALTLALACAGPRDLAAPETRNAAGADPSSAPRDSRPTPITPSNGQASTDATKIAEQVTQVIGGPAERNELTIDPRLQAIAEEEAAWVVSTFHARRATAIILDPAKGEILALANPDTARQAYVTGSTMKTLTIAAALDAGRVRAGQKFDCQPRPGEKLHDATPHGWLDLAQIMEVSSNVGVLRVYQALGDARFERALTQFHLADERFPVQLRFAPFSTLPSATPGSFARDEEGGAVGDGFVSTPIHMLAAYAVFANRGEYIAPSLVRSVRDEAGRVSWRHAPKREQVLRAETAQAMLEMLELAVDGKNATGKAARVQGVRVAGKTGTSNLNGPNASQVYASFIGIVPADTPRYVILVGAVDPQEGKWGGTVAAPAFARIARRALALNASSDR